MEFRRVVFGSRPPAAVSRRRPPNDVGTQYRSVVFYGSPQQEAEARESLAAYQKKLTEAGFSEITTEVVPASEFYFAEDFHQQYLSDNKNPNGYCPDHATGVSAPVGAAEADV